MSATNDASSWNTILRQPKRYIVFIAIKQVAFLKIFVLGIVTGILKILVFILLFFVTIFIFVFIVDFFQVWIHHKGIVVLGIDHRHIVGDAYAPALEST